MTTPLGKVTGIGPRTVEFLQARGIESVESLLQADVSILIAAPGFGANRANAVLQAAKTLLGSTAMPVVEEKTGAAARKKKKAGDKKAKGGKGKKRDKDEKKGGKNKGSDKKKKKGKKNKKGKKKKK